MIKCPVCYGRGRVLVNFYGEQTQTTDWCEPTCKSCNGTGIVMEYQPLNNDLQAVIDRSQQDEKEIKKLEAVVSSQAKEIKELKEKVLEAIDCENGCKICILIKEEVEKAVKNGK